jgi:GAF domain-containing protein
MPVDNPKIFATLAEALAEVEGVTETIDEIVRYAAENLGTDYGAFTLIKSRGRDFVTMGATHPMVVDVDRLQYELGEGPCLDAASNGTIVVSHLAGDNRWPSWRPRAIAMGFNSVLSAELHARGRRIGALNLYGVTTASFDREDVELAALFARQGALALGYAQSEEGLKEALETRTVIGQAQGLLMERFDIDADRAFATLRRYSQARNIKLKALCRELLDTRTLPAEGA